MNMKQKSQNPKILRFWTGIIVVGVSVMLMFIGVAEFRMWPIPFGIMGIVLIGTSRYRHIKK